MFNKVSGVFLLVLVLSCSIPTSISSDQNVSLELKPFIEIFPPIELDPSGRYILTWEVDRVNQVVTFSVVVKTNGYVGFGISKSGKMTGADIVVAEFNVNGRIIFQDYHGTGNGAPQLDDIQNWTLETFQRNGTHTMFVCSRLYDTGDVQGDLVIKDEETHFIWALSANENPELEYHGSLRGTYGINILYPGSSTATPETPEPSTVTNEYSSTTDFSEPSTTAQPISTFPTSEQPTSSRPTDSTEYTHTMEPITDSPSTLQPGTNITCDFEDILVHPFPPPCYVEFLCYNLAESILVNNCDFIDLDPRSSNPRTKPLGTQWSRADPISCDLMDVLVYPFPPPCRVEFICHNFGAIIHVNNCGFIDF